MKILATVGCSGFPFDRLFRILDSLCEKGILSGKEIVAQTGKITYPIRHYRYFEFVDNETMRQYQSDADLVICHAGTGTVVGSLKMGKKVIVFPRLARFGEHESDHQLDLAREFTEEGYVLCAMDEAELEDALRRAVDFHPKPFVSNQQNFLRLIRSLI